MVLIHSLYRIDLFGKQVDTATKIMLTCPRVIKMTGSKYQRAMNLKDEEFKLLVGVSKQTAEDMRGALQEAYNAKHKRRGRHSKLPVEDMLMMTMEYWRQYPTLFELGFEFGLAKSSVHDIIVWVEEELIKCGLFKLPGKKALLSNDDIEIVLVDVTESPIERPKKNKSDITQAKRKNTR